MKNKCLMALLVLFISDGLRGQKAVELDSKYIKLPRFASQSVISVNIPSPEQGMMVYNDETHSFWYYNGTGWLDITNGFNVPLTISSGALTLNSQATGMSSGAGVFSIENSLNTGSALTTFTNGSGSALEARTSGTGNAAFFAVNNPSSTAKTLEIYSNGAAGGSAIFSQNNGLGEAAYFQISNVSNNSAVLTASTMGSGRAFQAYALSGVAGYFTSSSGVALSTGFGNVGIGTVSPGSRLEVNGFTKLGSGDEVPKIKMKELSLTTAGSANGDFSVAHGLTASKIISVEVHVAAGALYIPPMYEPDLQLRYNYYFTSDRIYLQNMASGCSTGVHICNKPATILVTYKE